MRRSPFLLALLLGTAALAQDAGTAALPLPTAKTEVVPGKVKLGEPFAFRITLEHPKDERVELETPKSLGDFELLDTQRQRSDEGERATTVFTLKLSLFALGAHDLPPLTFDVTTPDGVRPLEVKGAKVEAVSSLPADAEKQGAELEDLKPLEPVPVRTYRLIYALLTALAVGAGLYLLWRWWKNRPPPVLRVPPPLPLDVRVRQQLDALAAERLPEEGRQREFYFRLSEIVRGYLQERYDIDALECTSHELLAKLETLEAPNLPRAELVHFVRESDFVKFARAEVTPQTCAEALALGHSLLARTWPPPLPETAAPNVPGQQLP